MAVGNVQDVSKSNSERNASRGEVFIKCFINDRWLSSGAVRWRHVSKPAITSIYAIGGFDTPFGRLLNHRGVL